MLFYDVRVFLFRASWVGLFCRRRVCGFSFGSAWGKVSHPSTAAWKCRLCFPSNESNDFDRFQISTNSSKRQKTRQKTSPLLWITKANHVLIIMDVLYLPETLQVAVVHATLMLWVGLDGIWVRTTNSHPMGGTTFCFSRKETKHKRFDHLSFSQ